MVGLPQRVALKSFRCSKGFDFLATVLVRGGGVNGKAERSSSHGSEIQIGRRVISGVIAGITGFGDGGGL